MTTRTGRTFSLYRSKHGLSEMWCDDHLTRSAIEYDLEKRRWVLGNAMYEAEIQPQFVEICSLHVVLLTGTSGPTESS